MAYTPHSFTLSPKGLHASLFSKSMGNLLLFPDRYYTNKSVFISRRVQQLKVPLFLSIIINIFNILCKPLHTKQIHQAHLKNSKVSLK